MILKFYGRQHRYYLFLDKISGGRRMLESFYSKQSLMKASARDPECVICLSRLTKIREIE